MIRLLLAQNLQLTDFFFRKSLDKKRLKRYYCLVNQAKVAQLVEHSTENAGVVGSIPSLGTFAFLGKSLKPH